ncbi:MAG TPA: flagellar brake protein [Gallionellaceae bacterium]|nr:flagellar brake protein [Gallionellaceae bacterium]
MSKEFPLTVEKFQDGEDSKFRISSPKEIRLTLNAIAQKKSAVLLHFDNNQNFLKSTLLAVDETGMWLDVSPSEDDNKLLLKSDSITLVTRHLGAKVQFVCRQIEMSVYGSQPAFYCPLPQLILRLQRRDFFRVPTSYDTPLKCIIPPLPTSETSTKPDEVTIMNISEGGIALICKENNIKLEEGAIYPNCRIELPEIGTLLTAIQVKSLFEVTLPNGIITKHAGCEFVRLEARMSMLLQRYVGIMQSKLSKLV